MSKLDLLRDLQRLIVDKRIDFLSAPKISLAMKGLLKYILLLNDLYEDLNKKVDGIIINTSSGSSVSGDTVSPLLLMGG